MPDALVPVPPFTNVPGVGKIPNHLPFFYDAMRSTWTYFPVDPSLVADLLEAQGFAPVLFRGKAYVNVNIQNFTALGNSMNQATNTMEFNAVAYPLAAEKRTARSLTIDEYLAGGDQTKTIGNVRISVVCDNAFAVAVGKALYSEPKIQGSFDYQVPSLSYSSLSVPPISKADLASWQYGYTYTAFDGPDTTLKNPPKKKKIFSLDFNLEKCPSVPSNITELMEMGFHNNRPIALRWPIHDTLTTYKPKGAAVTLGYGSSTSDCRKQLYKIVGKTKATHIQVYQSRPVISTHQAIYLDLS